MHSSPHTCQQLILQNNIGRTMSKWLNYVVSHSKIRVVENGQSGRTGRLCNSLWLKCHKIVDFDAR